MNKKDAYMVIKRADFPRQKAKTYMGMLKNMTDEEADKFVNSIFKR